MLTFKVSKHCKKSDPSSLTFKLAENVIGNLNFK